MAWTNLSSAFGFGSVLTSTQMQNLRDNLAALAAGDSGAPAIQTAALDGGIVTNDKIANQTINAYTKMAQCSAGNTAIVKLVGSTGVTTSSTASSYPVGQIRGFDGSQIWGLTCIKGGTIRIYADLCEAAGGSANIGIYRNGVLMTTFTEGSNYPAFVSHTYDQILDIGDELVIIFYAGGSTTAYLRYLQIRASSADYCVV